MDGLAKFVNNQDLKELELHSNKPLGLLQLTARDLADLKNQNQIDLYSHVQLNATLVNLTNSMGY